MAAASTFVSANADQMNQANSTAGAVSSSNAVGAITNPTANSSANSSVVSSPTTTSSVDFKPTNTLSSLGAGGDAKSDVKIEQNFQASKIPPSTPLPVVPGVPVPQIFGGLNAPATVSGIPLILKYLDDCQPVATRKNKLQVKFSDGASEKTAISFMPNQDYQDKREVIVTKQDQLQKNWDGNPSYVSDSVVQPVETVRISFPTQAKKYTCLGILTVMAKKKESGVPFTAILSDAQIYPLENMTGYKNILLVSVRDAIATALGVGNSGSGISVAPGISALATNALTAGALSLGYSSGTGGTFSDSQIGTTFLVLSLAANSEGVVIDPAQIHGSYPHHTQPSENNGKKYEATH